MTVSIGSNPIAQKVQRSLGAATEERLLTSERLASGQRINRASDDAAGLSIAEKLGTDTRVYAAAIRNISDGISLASIRDGALDQLSGILIRQSELAEQSANGSYSNLQRQALDREAQALSAEYNRIVATTKFNGIGILDGTTTNTRIQAGYGTAQSVEMLLGLGHTGATSSANVTINVGTGTFQNAVNYAGGNGADDPVLMDVNSDGKMDIVNTAWQDSSVGYLLGNGDGTFGARVNIFFQAGVGFAGNPQAVDINGDGRTDIITSNLVGDDFNAFLSNGDGTFQSVVTSDANLGLGTHFAIGDVDEDGEIDIVASNGDNPNASDYEVYLGDGNGNFTGQGVQNINGTFGNAKYGLLADINGNGHLDYITSSFADNRIYVLLDNGGNGTFQAAVSISVGGINTGSGDPFAQIFAADVNGDSRIDLAINSPSQSNVIVLTGNGDGSFATHGTYNMGTTTATVQIRDINNDGFGDMVATSYDDRVNIRLGQSGGTFGVRVSYAVGNDPFNFTMGDVNGDGVADIVTGNQASNNLSVLIANSTQTSSTVTITSGASVASAPAFNLLTQSNARSALDLLRSSLDSLNRERGRAGSELGRLDVARNVLETTRENYIQARSRIVDADMAAEAAKQVRLSILQRTGASVLGQANQLPQLALTLLQNAGT